MYHPMPINNANPGQVRILAASHVGPDDSGIVRDSIEWAPLSFDSHSVSILKTAVCFSFCGGMSANVDFQLGPI